MEERQLFKLLFIFSSSRRSGSISSSNSHNFRNGSRSSSRNISRSCGRNIRSRSNSSSRRSSASGCRSSSTNISSWNLLKVNGNLPQKIVGQKLEKSRKFELGAKFGAKFGAADAMPKLEASTACVHRSTEPGCYKSTTLHGTTLHYTALHGTTLHYTTLNYTTLATPLDTTPEHGGRRVAPNRCFVFCSFSCFAPEAAPQSATCTSVA